MGAHVNAAEPAPQATAYYVRIVDRNQESLFRATEHLKKHGFEPQAVQLATHPMNSAPELQYRKIPVDGHSLRSIKLLYMVTPSSIGSFRQAIHHLNKKMQVDLFDTPVRDLAPAWPLPQ